MTMELHEHVQALGDGKTRYNYDHPDSSLLEMFPSPFSIPEMNAWQVKGSILIECPEFTSLCPKTGQPDFAKIVIEYTPDKWCVESKSLKLYLGSFRNHGEFHESCVNRIANDLVQLLNPIKLKVRGEFTPRGGIPFWPTALYEK
jgi:7-cyano-7-deazaguanine reductase